MGKNYQFDEFKLHLYKGYVQNNFIIEYNNKILLIDGACKPDAFELVNFIESVIKRPVSDLKLVAVTHCHPDHAGAAGTLKRKFDIPVAAPSDMRLWYSGIGGTMQYVSDTLQSQFMAKMQNRSKRIESLFFERLLDIDFPLDDGNTLPFFDDWNALAAPGHTSHNMIYYNEKNSILYVADTIIDSGTKYLPPVPVLFPEKMKNTLYKIKNLKPEFLLLAHSDKGLIKYSDAIIDDVIKKIDSEDPVFIKLFYNISKFTKQYRIYRERRSDNVK